MARSSVAVGGLVVGALVLLVAGIAWLRQPSGETYYADLPDARGLRVGAPVRLRGLDVGHVTDIGFTDSSLRVTFVVTRRDAPLRDGTAFRVRQQGLLGDYAAELVPGAGVAAPPLRPGAVLRVAAPDAAELRQQAAAESIAVALRQALDGRARRDTLRGPDPRTSPP